MRLRVYFGPVRAQSFRNLFTALLALVIYCTSCLLPDLLAQPFFHPDQQAQGNARDASRGSTEGRGPLWHVAELACSGELYESATDVPINLLEPSQSIGPMYTLKKVHVYVEPGKQGFLQILDSDCSNNEPAATAYILFHNKVGQGQGDTYVATLAGGLVKAVHTIKYATGTQVRDDTKNPDALTRFASLVNSPDSWLYKLAQVPKSQ